MDLPMHRDRCPRASGDPDGAGIVRGGGALSARRHGSPLARGRQAFRAAGGIALITAAFASTAHAQSPDKLERIVPAKPQSVAPKAAPRTSTWERNVFFMGSLLTFPDAKSPEACRDACLRNASCGAWHHNAAAGNPRPCWLLKSVETRHTSSEDATNKIVGGTISPPPGARERPEPKSVPATEAQKREIERKAKVKEKENGFCARVNWPKYPSFSAALVTWQPGTTVAFRIQRSDEPVSICAVHGIRSGYPRKGSDGRDAYFFDGFMCSVGGQCQEDGNRFGFAK
jgi:hypothetical protein